ncbi:MAG TPA: MoaD/ThiS family protein [Chloroflexota bacterium]|nr:MoaD/ThiS family protein [Chloroflexota bacterium]
MVYDSGAREQDEAVRVTVLFFGDVRKFLPPGKDRLTCSLAASTTVADLMDSLGVVPTEDGLVVGVNGHIVTPDQTFRDGDEISLITPMMGG